MPIFQYQTTNKTGKNVYVYSTQGENLVGVAQSIAMNSQGQPQFTYIPPGGMPPGQPIAAEQLDASLAQGGVVRGVITAANGVSISAQFTNSELMLIPADGQQATCTSTLGGGAMGMGYAQQPYQQQGYPQPDPYGNQSGYDPMAQQQQQMGYDPNAGYYGDQMMQQQNALVDPRAAQGEDPMRDTQIGEDVVKTGNWFLTLLLLAIPGVNVISIIVWLAGRKTKKSKKNYIKAVLIMYFISILLISLMTILFGTVITATLQEAGLLAANSTTAITSNVTSEDADETDSLSASTQSITGNSETVTETEEAAEESAVRVTLDNSVVVTVGEQQIFVLTATLINNSTETIQPGNVLTFDALQGVEELALYSESIEETSYYPSSQNVSIEPGSQSGFKVAFILSNTTDVVDITVCDLTGVELAYGEFSSAA